MADLNYQKSWQDPAPGTVITIPCGEPLELLFTCHNDAEKVVTFTAEVSGLGPWAPEKTPTLPVVPFESGQIKVPITSSDSAAPGDYPFSVARYLNGDPVEPDGTTNLVLRLTPGVRKEEPAPPTKVETPVEPPKSEEPPKIQEPEVVAPPQVKPEKPKAAPRAKREDEPREVKTEKLTEKVKEPKSETKRTEPVAPRITVEEPVSVVEAPPAIIPEPTIEAPKEKAVEPLVVDAPTLEPEAKPESKPEPVQVKPLEPAPPISNGPKLIDLGPPPPARPQPEPEAEPEPEPIPIPVEEPKPVYVPPTPVAPKVVDYGTKEEEPEEVEDVAAAYPSDHQFANPKEGTVLYARPGETILVRFSVSNDQGGVRTYVLQEDRSLPNEWIQLVRDQVNITPGGTGDVAFLLKPPIHAEPASYPFSVSFGVLGKPLSSCYLTLTVQATPAVTVGTKKSLVSVGPISRRVPFEFQVDSAGNADTAYRLTVIDDSPAPDGTPQEPVPIYETPTWQYLIDKEIDTLVSPTAGRTPPAMPHRMFMVRKGTWWFGWREKHTVKVATVPVTDQRNNEKPGNVISITGARWRIFPLPMFLMIPLMFIALVMLGSGGDNLRVANGIQGDDGAFYVIGTEPNQNELPVHLKWSSPVYALLKLNRLDQGRASSVSTQRESASDRATVQDYGQAQKLSYELGSKFFGSGIKTDVRFVPMKSDGMLQIFDGSNPVSALPGKEPIGEEKVDVFTQEITVEVERGKTKAISFRNLTGTGKINGQTIVAWTVRQPQGFIVSDFLIKQGDNQVLNPNSAMTAKIRFDSENPPPDGEAVWELLTTDAKNQLLRIKLKVVGE